MTRRRIAGMPYPLLVAAGILLLALAGAEIWFLTSKARREAANRKASESFGEALDRAGIRTQEGPSR